MKKEEIINNLRAYSDIDFFGDYQSENEKKINWVCPTIKYKWDASFEDCRNKV